MRLTCTFTAVEYGTVRPEATVFASAIATALPRTCNGSTVGGVYEAVEPTDSDAAGTITSEMIDGFDSFYRAQYPAAVGLAWLLTHDHAAAEDVVQDAFIHVRPRLATVDHPAAYLRQSIVNGCRDRARSSARADARRRLERATLEVSTVDRPSELLDAVAGLPYKHRAVLVLRYWADLPESEIATIVGVRPGTVRSITARLRPRSGGRRGAHRARALARLRKELPSDR